MKEELNKNLRTIADYSFRTRSLPDDYQDHPAISTGQMKTMKIIAQLDGHKFKTKK